VRLDDGPSISCDFDCDEEGKEGTGADVDLAGSRGGDGIRGRGGLGFVCMSLPNKHSEKR
jgi:hypothetical protein